MFCVFCGTRKEEEEEEEEKESKSVEDIGVIPPLGEKWSVQGVRRIRLGVERGRARLHIDAGTNVGIGGEARIRIRIATAAQSWQT